MKDKLIKVITWRLISIAVTMGVLSVMMDSVKSASAVTLFLHTLLTVCHFIFENSWEKFYEGR